MGFQKILVQVTWVGVILAEMASAAVAAPLANRDCPKMCGNLEIPYPFGTTKDCYLDEFFFIDCKLISSTGLYEPRFANIIVTNISYHGHLDILMFIANACYNETGFESRNEPYLRVGANYTISSTQNQLVAVGCDTYAFLSAYRNNEQFAIGCTSICQSISNVINGSCSGIGCCEVMIPPGLKNFTLLPRSYNNHKRKSYKRNEHLILKTENRKELSRQKFDMKRMKRFQMYETLERIGKKAGNIRRLWRDMLGRERSSGFK
ncbi:Wall-associated receptor kinase 2 [Morella rubra]|uniref:Wall-associated receptor kinase 2 n=1 Tax=Morella rubra TaxID=262757 RepID=A0A6A1VI04_9ROSI|nr:Wall-associated receptor kinase 2 [Morella rubra]